MNSAKEYGHKGIITGYSRELSFVTAKRCPTIDLPTVATASTNGAIVLQAAVQVGNSLRSYVSQLNQYLV